MTAQPKNSRTPTAWRNAVLDILQRKVHPDYEWNRAAKGRVIELVRRDDPSGLFVTYSFLRIRDEYYSNYAVTLSLHSHHLITPFMAGSRFDNNRVIWQLFDDDFGIFRGDDGYPPCGVWSHGRWRDNTLDILESRLPAPERHLLPRYLRALRSVKHRLVEFIELGAELCERFNAPTLAAFTPLSVLQERAPDFGCDPDVVALIQRAIHPDALRIGGALPCRLIGSCSSDRVNLAELDLRSVAFSRLVDFFENRADLADFAATLRRL